MIMDLGSGFDGYRCFEIFSWNTINSVIIIDIIVINQVDVSSCGIPLRGGLNSQSLT